MADSDETEKWVVVVTDDPLLSEEVAYSFPPEFFVEVVADARKARELMQDGAPDVAVVDLQTGSAGGFGLARDMGQDARLASVPILMLLERDADRWLARQGGARSIQVKPIGVDALVRETLALIDS